MNLLRTSWGRSSTEPLKSEILLRAELLSGRKNKIICVQKKNIYTDSSTLQFDFEITWKFRGSSLKYVFWISDDFELIVNWFWEQEYITNVVVLEVWGLLLGFGWSWEHDFIYLFIIVGVVEELGICMSDNVCDFVIFRWRQRVKHVGQMWDKELKKTKKWNWQCFAPDHLWENFTGCIVSGLSVSSLRFSHMELSPSLTRANLSSLMHHKLPSTKQAYNHCLLASLSLGKTLFLIHGFCTLSFYHLIPPLISALSDQIMH